MTGSPAFAGDDIYISLTSQCHCEADCAYNVPMIRPFFTELVLFLTPFALYALFLWVTKRSGLLDRANWPMSHVAWLLIAACLLVIASFVVLANWGAVPPGSTYIPAHMEDGKFIPGQTK